MADDGDLFNLEPKDGEGHDEVHHDEDQIIQRSNYPWVTHEDELMGKSEGDHLDTTTIEEVAKHYGVPELVFEQYMAKEIHEAESCYGLPFTLLLVISYAGMMISHHDAITVHSVEGALIEQIEKRARFAFSNDFVGFKNLYNVNSRKDFYSWLNNGLVPLIFDEVEKDWESSEGWDNLNYTLPEELVTTTPRPPLYTSAHGIVSFYNRIIGGIRLVQERVADDETGCESLKPLRDAYGKECTGGLRYELSPDPFGGRRTVDAERMQWLWEHDNASTTNFTLAEMERSNWLDEKTQKVEVALATFNGEHNLYTYITINFFFSRGGSIWKRIIPESVFADQYPADGAMYMVFDIAWMVCLFFILVSESREVHQTIKRIGCGKEFFKSYFSLWNSVDWLSVIYGVVIIILASVFTAKVSYLNSHVAALPGYSPFWKDADEVEKYRETAEKSVERLEYLAFFLNRCRVLFACYPLVISMRVLKAFSAQPRLAMVTTTLWSAGQDLLHFMFVFVGIFGAFVICSIMLFGRNMDEFATPTFAIIACFRCSVGDFDWDRMREVGAWEASVFLYSFLTIISFMFFNILLAIVMSAYYEVASDVATSDTLVAEVKQAYARWLGVRRGDMVPLLEVAHQVKLHKRELRVLYEAKGNNMDLKLQPLLNRDGQLRLVTVEFLRHYVMKMRTAQAHELLESAVEWYGEDLKKASHVDQMLQMMNEMESDLKDLKKAFVEGPDSSSDSDVEHSAAKRQAASAAATAKQRLFDKQRRNTFHEYLIEGKTELHHATLWIREDAMANQRNLLALEMTAKAAKESATKVKFEVDDDEDDDVAMNLLTLEESIERNDHLAQEILDFEDKLKSEQYRMSMALEEIEELEPRLLKASEETTDVATRFHQLRQSVAVLVEERHRTHDESAQGRVAVKSAHLSRSECFDLVQSLTMENDALRHQLDQNKLRQEQARAYMIPTAGAIEKAERHMEPRLQEVKRLAPKAAKVRFEYYSGMLEYANELERAAKAEGCPEVLKVAEAVKSMFESAKFNQLSMIKKDDHLGIMEEDNVEDSLIDPNRRRNNRRRASRSSQASQASQRGTETNFDDIVADTVTGI